MLRLRDRFQLPRVEAIVLSGPDNPHALLNAMAACNKKPLRKFHYMKLMTLLLNDQEVSEVLALGTRCECGLDSIEHICSRLAQLRFLARGKNFTQGWGSGVGAHMAGQTYARLASSVV